MAAGFTGEEGLTGSSFPVTCGAFDTDFGGDTDATLLLLNPGGNGASDLQYATFVGGTGFQNVYDLYLVADSTMPTVVVSGNGTGPDFPTTPGAYQESFGGGPSDCHVFRFSMNPHTFCAAAANSYSASGALICGTGTTSLSASDLVLGVRDAAPNQPGLFYFGPNAVQLPFGDGFRCVGGMVTRLGPPQSSNAVGMASRTLDLTAPPLNVITAGSIWSFQFWYRDPAMGGAGFNLSNGLRTLFLP